MIKFIIGVAALFAWSHICVRAGYELGVVDTKKEMVPRG